MCVWGGAALAVLSDLISHVFLKGTQYPSQLFLGTADVFPSVCPTFFLLFGAAPSTSNNVLLIVQDQVQMPGLP